MNKIVKNALILMAITLVAGTGLGSVYEITKEPIAAREKQAKKAACQAVFSDMVSTARIMSPDTDLSPAEMEQEEAAIVIDFDAEDVMAEHDMDDIRIEEAHAVRDASGAHIGVVLNITTFGYGGEINFSMGIRKDGTVNGIEILSISETAGLGMRATEEAFKGQFAGKKVGSFAVTKDGASADNEIDAISGATVTSTGITRGVNAGICYFESLKEGGIFDE